MTMRVVVVVVVVVVLLALRSLSLFLGSEGIDPGLMRTCAYVADLCDDVDGVTDLQTEQENQQRGEGGGDPQPRHTATAYVVGKPVAHDGSLGQWRQ